MKQKILVLVVTFFPTLCMGINQPAHDFLPQIFTFNQVNFVHKNIQLFSEESLSTVNNRYFYGLKHTLAKKFGGKWDITLIKNQTYAGCLLLTNDKGNVIISYPGSLYDTKKNADIRLKSFAIPPNSKIIYGAHQGFYEVFLKSWPQLKQAILNYKKTIKTEPEFIISGFSRGGASANLAALFLRAELGEKKIHLMTFGAPAVFDQRTADIFNQMIGKENTLRFVVTEATVLYGKKSIKGTDKVSLLTSNKLMPFAHTGIKFPLTIKFEETDKNEFQTLKKEFNGIFGAHFYYDHALTQYRYNHPNTELDFQNQLALSHQRIKKDATAKKILSTPSRLLLGVAGKLSPR